MNAATCVCTIDSRDGSIVDREWDCPVHGTRPAGVPGVAAPAADPDVACRHLDFRAEVNVGRITEEDGITVKAFIAEITIHCDECGEPFRWTGVRAGLMLGNPTCSVDERTLNAPIRPASADPDFGLGIPGFAIRYDRDRG